MFVVFFVFVFNVCIGDFFIGDLVVVIGVLWDGLCFYEVCGLICV